MKEFEKLLVYPIESLIFMKGSISPSFYLFWSFFWVSWNCLGWFSRGPQGTSVDTWLFWWSEKQLNKINFMDNLWWENAVVLVRVIYTKAVRHVVLLLLDLVKSPGQQSGTKSLVIEAIKRMMKRQLWVFKTMTHNWAPFLDMFLI